jgi:hypothetical protein
MPSKYDWLTAQEKLALAMTTAGSMRGLASFMGITHQKLGRWLREGYEGGIKAIPQDAETTALIDSVFESHRDIARAEAESYGIPFDEETPVFASRKYLSKTDEFGEPILGDRVFVENTQFINSNLRQSIMYGVHESGLYYSASVRSVIELALYLQTADERIGKFRRKPGQYEHLASLLLAVEDDEEEFRPIFTPIQIFRPGSSGIKAVKSIEAYIRQRHEPATGEKQTSLADQYLMQLIPRNYVDPRSARAKRANARRKKPKGGRGPK